MKTQKIKINLYSFIIGFGIGSIFFCLYYFLGEHTLKRALDGVSISTVILLCVGMLMFVSFLGAFDTFAFGFKQLGTMLFNKDTPKKENYNEYLDNKRVVREHSNRPYIGMLISGAVFAFATIVLEIIYHTIF